MVSARDCRTGYPKGTFVQIELKKFCRWRNLDACSPINKTFRRLVHRLSETH
jgi:hypothetical protein